MYNRSVRLVAIAMPFCAILTASIAFAAFKPVVAPPQAVRGMEDVRVPQAPEQAPEQTPVAVAKPTGRSVTAAAPKTQCQDYVAVQKLRLTGSSVVSWGCR